MLRPPFGCVVKYTLLRIPCFRIPCFRIPLFSYTFIRYTKAVALGKRIKTSHKAAVADGFATATFLNTKQAHTWSAVNLGSCMVPTEDFFYHLRVDGISRPCWNWFSNHEGSIRGLSPICVVDPLLWLPFVSSGIGRSFFYSLWIINLRCLLILYYVLFSFFSN